MDTPRINRDMLLLAAAALGVGLMVGLWLAPRGNQSQTRNAHNTTDNRHNTDNLTDNRRINDRKRVSTNVVFGNIIVGSNNAPDSVMSFGNEDDGDN